MRTLVFVVSACTIAYALGARGPAPADGGACCPPGVECAAGVVRAASPEAEGTLDGGLPMLEAEVMSAKATLRKARKPDGSLFDAPEWLVDAHVVNRSGCDWVDVSDPSTELDDANGILTGQMIEHEYPTPDGRYLTKECPDPRDFNVRMRFAAANRDIPPATLHIVLLRYQRVPLRMSWDSGDKDLTYPLTSALEGLRITVSAPVIADVPVPFKEAHAPHPVMSLVASRLAEGGQRPFVGWSNVQFYDTRGELVLLRGINSGGDAKLTEQGAVAEEYRVEYHLPGEAVPRLRRIVLAVDQWRRVPALEVTCPVPDGVIERPATDG